MNTTNAYEETRTHDNNRTYTTDAKQAPGPAGGRGDIQDQGVVLIAVYHYVIGAVFLLATIILGLPTLLLGVIGFTHAAPALLGMLAVGLVAAVVMAFCLVFIATGYGLWAGKQWARITAITLAILTLLFFPLGTIAGGLIVWHLIKPDVALRFE